MRILFALHDEWNPDAGGMGVTSGLAEVYGELGHEVEYLSFADLPGFLPTQVKALLFPSFAAARLRRSTADVIDAAVGDGWLFGVLRRDDGAGPLLVTRSHGITYGADRARRREAARGGLQLSWKYPIYWGGFRIWEEAKSLREAGLCLLLNGGERSYVVERLGVPKERVRVVDNGLPRDMLGLPFPALDPAEPFRIAHIGSFLSHKGVRYAVAALDSTLAANPSARASFLGFGHGEEAVLSGFRPEVRERVDLVPRYRRADLPALLSGHSVLLSASLTEGFPLGVLEAMACGLTSVIADIPGPTQYVRDGENGLLAPEADAAALAAAIQRLIDAPQLLERLRSAAHATAQEYSWDRIGRETLEHYEAALTRRRGH